MPISVKCQVCHGTGINRSNEACFCTQPCRSCGAFDRGPLGHCRPCNTKHTREYQQRALAERRPCPTCGVFDRSASGACRPCFKRRNRERIERGYLCQACKTTDWNPSGGCRTCLRARRIAKWSSYALIEARRRNKSLNLPMTIDVDWIETRFTLQAGKCHYTGVKLQPEKCGSRSPFQPSLDRIDNRDGYTPDNCCLTSLGWNFMRNEASVSEALEFLSSIKETK